MAWRPVIEYGREYEFAVTPSELWEGLQQVEEFERWWPWLEEFRRGGEHPGDGAVLHGVVAPPLPYRMRIRVELTRRDSPVPSTPSSGAICEGEGAAEVRAAGTGSRVEVRWTVEMMQRPMRLATRFGRPLMQWGHDRVVEMTVAGFRRRLESAG